MSERVLFHGLAAQRLRSRTLWAGVVLLVTIVMPYDVVGDVPQWIFGLLPELHPAAIVAAFAPTAAGLAILVARRTTKRASSLALVVIAALLVMALFERIGADASAWELLHLPRSIERRTVPVMLAMALAAAGANLSFKEHTRQASRVLLEIALAMVLLFYAWPTHGESPLGAVWRLLRGVPDAPGRFALGLVVVALFILFPLLTVFAAATHIRFPSKRERSLLGLLAELGLPILLLLFVYRSLLMGAAGAGVLVTLAAAAFLAAILALLAASIEILADEIFGDDAEIELPQGLSRPRAAIIAGGVALALVIAQIVLARPPKKGVAWALHDPTPDETKLYVEGLPAWNFARRAWGEKVTAASSAEEMVQLKAADHALVEMSKDLDGRLRDAVGELSREGDEVDVAGRKFERLVTNVNDAARAASVPFYLDPSVQIAESKEGLVRTFRVTSYRIEKVHAFVVDGADFATLQVRTLGGFGGHGGALGFSRDVQPFALVVLDEIDHEVESWQRSLDQDEPSCVEGYGSYGDDALERCAALLTDLAKQGDANALKDAQIVMTERHELQHQIDGPHLVTSPFVDRHMMGYTDDAIWRTNRELSAYLAEMTSAAPPHLGLVHILPFALLANGGPEHHVGIILFHAMTDREVPHATKSLDLDEMHAAFEELASLSPGDLRARAAATWKKAFGDPLPQVVAK
jgi:hypothetical protein